MKLGLVLSAALAGIAAGTPATQDARPRPSDFRFERSVSVAPGQALSACAVLDGSVYRHASTSLDDLRMFSAGQETPYAITVSNAASLSPSGEQAKVLNLGTRGGHIAFDLLMPNRRYSEVDLGLTGVNFLATAKVSGEMHPGGAATNLGSFTLFDLSGQNLGRSTSLPLPESSFAYLHVDLNLRGVGGTITPDPAMVTGASVPPSREAQTIYTEVARTSTLTQQENETVATFMLPARVPVERVRFEIPPRSDLSFSRAVTIAAHPDGAPEDEQEVIAGRIDRVRLQELGQELRSEDLDVNATLGANARVPARVSVSVRNGDDRPLPITAVVLEMRERKLCFPVSAAAETMFYGDAGLRAPEYDFSQTFQTAEMTRVARLGPEQQNPGFVPPAEPSPSFADRHPQLIWVTLLGALAVLAAIALLTAKKTG